jgi:hypothetical protein
MGQYVDNTGLLRKLGQDEATVGKGGHYRKDGPAAMIEFDLGLFSALPDDATTVVNGTAQGIVDKHTMIPEAVLIEKVELITTVGATSAGSARLDVGVVDIDFVGNDDDDALIAAELYESMGTVGNIVTYTQGSTRHGDLVGTITTKPLYVTASYDTAVFATGRAKLRIHYSH